MLNYASRLARAGAPACVLFVGACVSSVPESSVYERVEPPDAWDAARPASAHETEDWLIIAGSDLSALIDAALSRNLDLEGLRLSIEAARIQLDGVRTRLRPSLGLSGPTASVARVRGSDGLVESYAITATTSYELDLWGRVANDVELAQLSLEGRRNALSSARIAIAATVSRLYYSIRVQDELLRLEQEQLAVLRNQRELTAVNFEVGQVTQLTLDQLDVSIQQRLSRLAAARIERDATERALARLLGEPPQAFSLEARDFEFLVIPRILADAPAVTLTQRPDVRDAERQILAAGISLQNARNAWLPTVSVAGSTGTSAASIGDLLTDPTIATRLALSLTMTLYDDGVRARQVDQQRLARDQAMLSYNRTVLNALSEVENALAAQNTNIQQIEIQRAEQRAQERVTEITEVLFETGEASAFDLVREQSNVLNARRARVLTWQSGMQASIALLQAFGVDPSSASPAG